MFRPLASFAVLFAALAGQAATLQKMSLEEMAAGATAIVRARVTASTAALTGNTIYTHYRLEVAETWKGKAPLEVMLPGGTANRTRQSFPGVPELNAGSDYVLFLWTSPSGITHLVGLTQGIFNVASGADGVAMASRPQSGELMLDAKGQKVSDQAIHMSVVDMKSRVGTRPGSGAAK